MVAVERGAGTTDDRYGIVHALEHRFHGHTTRLILFRYHNFRHRAAPTLLHIILKRCESQGRIYTSSQNPPSKLGVASHKRRASSLGFSTRIRKK